MEVRPQDGTATEEDGAAVLSENRKWFGLVGAPRDRKQEVGQSSEGGFAVKPAGPSLTPQDHR